MTTDAAREPDRVEHDPRPPTLAGPESLVEIADEVWVLPDAERIAHVPNIGFIAGERTMLVVESGVGIANGERTLAIARELAGDRPLIVTATHHHPEHGYGVQAFDGEATIVYNAVQRDELFDKQAGFVEMFSSFTPHLEAALEGVEYVAPDIVYADSAEIDLGGRVVHLSEVGPAHTAGDQIVHLREERILFAGDLVEERFFAIMGDPGCVPGRWIAELARLEALEPRVVVPGHGAISGPDLLTTAREELIAVRDATLAGRREGRDVADLRGRLSTEAHARHPDWANREWVGVVVECFYEEEEG